MTGEKELLERMQSGDIIAFNLLYEKYAPLLYGWITRLTNNEIIACSILQKSFIAIGSGTPPYNDSERTLFTWMLKITMKNCYTMLRLADKKMFVELRQKTKDDLHNR